MKKLLFTFLGAIVFAIGTTTTTEAVAKTQINVVDDYSHWYNMGYQAGWLDALSGKSYLYSQQRTLIPMWYFDAYMAGYNLGWQQAGPTNGYPGTGGGNGGGNPPHVPTPAPIDPGTVN